MRLVGAVLAVALAGSLAFGDDTPPPAKPAEKPAEKPADARPAEPTHTKVPLRLVKLLPETHQALLFDKNRGTHVLAEVGETVATYTVQDLSDDEVILAAPNGTQVILVLPLAIAPAPTTAPAAAPTAKPSAPAAAVVSKDPQPIDPYADPTPRVVEAPPEPATASAAAPTTAPAAAPTTAPVAAPTTAPATAAAATPPAPPPDTFTIPRADLSFPKLANAIRASFTPAGVHIDAIAPNSLFTRAGLLSGDTITAVDNVQLHSLDDAATLYARAGTARNLTIHVLRGDPAKPVTLHVAIQ